MERKQVERFLAVVEHGSMTAAAKVLFLKQASISTSIRELEVEVGENLFRRGGKQLELTEAGRAFVEPAIQIQRSFEEAKAAVDDLSASGLSGRLYVGCSAALVTAPLMDLIARFCKAYPDVELRCEEVAPGLEAFDLLKGGRLELLFHNETPRRDLHRTLYATERLFAVLPPGSSIAEGDVSVEDIAPFGIIAAHTTAHSALRQASGEVATKRIDYKLPAVCDDRRLVAGLILRGVGVSILPESLALELEQQGAVLRAMAWSERQAWIYHRDGYLSTAARRLLELVDESQGDE